MKRQTMFIKTGCHSRGMLSGIYNACRYLKKGKTLLNKCVEAPRYQPSGMTPNLIPLTRPSATLSLQGRGGTAHGFTLIELLVVVLIIGILAAVAVPQYQQAVMKSKFIKLYNLAMTYNRVIQEYQLANGTYPTSFDELAIGKPAGTTENKRSNYSCMKNEKFYCCLIPQVSATAQAINCGDSNYTIAFHYMNKQKKQYCAAKKTDSVATKLCKSYGAREAGWDVFTPDGNQSGYDYYKMD